MADQHGLLLPDQVERVALHEIGHAIGMRGHSPIPADLMYEVVRDRLGPDGLGVEDVNSFLSLYAIPSGTVYTSLAPAKRQVADAPALPEGPPRLALAPHVDSQRGFEIQMPMGWLRIPTPFGVVAVNGVPWDYDASVQIIVRRYETIESYLERHAAAHFGTSVITSVQRCVGRRPSRQEIHAVALGLRPRRGVPLHRERRWAGADLDRRVAGRATVRLSLLVRRDAGFTGDPGQLEARGGSRLLERRRRFGRPTGRKPLTRLRVLGQ